MNSYIWLRAVDGSTINIVLCFIVTIIIIININSITITEIMLPVFLQSEFAIQCWC